MSILLDGGRPRTTLTNIVTNGDFVNTDSWPANITHKDFSVSSNIGTFIGTGATTAVNLGQDTGISYSVGHKLFVIAGLRVTNSGATVANLSMRFFTPGNTSSEVIGSTISDAVDNKWYIVNGVLTIRALDSGDLVIFASNVFPTTELAEDKVCNVQKVTVIDLTTIFGAGKEPTAAQMDRWLQIFAGYDNLSKLYSVNSGTIATTGTTSTIPDLTYSYKLSAGGYSTPATATASSIALPASGVETSELKLLVEGNTVTNILADAFAGCEDTTDWNTTNTAIATDNVEEYEGTNCLKVTLSAGQTQGNINRTVFASLVAGKYYLISAYIKNVDATNLKLRLETDDQDIDSTAVTVTDWTRVGIVVAPTDFDTATTAVIEPQINGAETQYGFVDAIMMQEITSAEYALGATALLSKYAWHLSTASTTAQTITCNSKTATTPITLHGNATVKDSYDMQTGVHVQKVNSSTYETLATPVITQYGKGSFIDTTKTIPKRIY